MEVSDLLPLGISLVVVTLVLAFGLQIVGSTKDDIGVQACASNTAAQGQTYNPTTDLCTNSTGSTSDPSSSPNSAAFNATEDGTLGLSKLTGKLPTIGLVLAAVVIIGILVKGFSNAGA